MRTYTVAANYDFMCPDCDHGLVNYLLLCKIAVGLSNSALRKEVFRAYDTFDNLNDIVFYTNYRFLLKINHKKKEKK